MVRDDSLGDGNYGAARDGTAAQVDHGEGKEEGRKVEEVDREFSIQYDMDRQIDLVLGILEIPMFVITGGLQQPYGYS